MSITDLERRLARIEAGRRRGAPTVILTDCAIGDTAVDLEASHALANCQGYMAEGKAGTRIHVECLVGPVMTDDGWAAQYVTSN